MAARRTGQFYVLYCIVFVCAIALLFGLRRVSLSLAVRFAWVQPLDVSMPALL